MQVKFTIVPSGALLEPSQEYFQGLVSAATLALTEKAVDPAGAWALCEYLDAVDGGSVAMNQALYRQSVAALELFFMQPSNRSVVAAYANKSWAAHTLRSMIASLKVRPLLQIAA